MYHKNKRRREVFVNETVTQQQKTSGNNKNFSFAGKHVICKFFKQVCLYTKFLLHRQESKTQ